MIAVYGKKIGMTQIFGEDGSLIPVSLLYVEPNVVVSHGDAKKDGCTSTILGAFKKGLKHSNKAELGFFKGIDPRKKLFKVDGFEENQVGDEIGVEIFEHVNFVDVTGTSKGKGYQGVMKRHGAHGGPASHGSKFHRAAGSTGQAATPSRVRKGTKMSGHMGRDTVTMQNLVVVKIDHEQNVLVVKGAVPGANGGAVLIKSAVKKGI